MLNRAEFPEAVAQPVQYGPRLQGIAAYLKNYGLLPYQRTAELFEDLFSIPISVGTLVSINELCGQQLEAVNDTIRSALRDESVIGSHLDETGPVDECGRQVVVAARGEHRTADLLHAAPQAGLPGREAMAEIGILPDFGGVLGGARSLSSKCKATLAMTGTTMGCAMRIICANSRLSKSNTSCGGCTWRAPNC